MHPNNNNHQRPFNRQSKKQSDASLGSNTSLFSNLSRTVSIQTTFNRIPGLSNFTKFLNKLQTRTLHEEEFKQNSNNFKNNHISNNLKSNSNNQLEEGDQEEKETEEEEREKQRKEKVIAGREIRTLKSIMSDEEEEESVVDSEAGQKTLASHASNDTLIVHKELSPKLRKTNIQVNVKPSKKNFGFEEKNLHEAEDEELQRRISENVANLTKAVRNRSVSTVMNHTKYMSQVLSKPNQELNNAMRRSIKRTKLTRSRHPDLHKLKVGSSRMKTLKSHNSKIKTMDSHTSKATEATELTETDENDPKFSATNESSLLGKDTADKTDTEIILEGKLEKKRNGQQHYKQWNQRYGVLRSNGLFYYENKKAYEIGQPPRGKILFYDLLAPNNVACEMMSPFKVFHLLGRSYVFQLHLQDDLIVFSVKSQKTLSTWVESINECYAIFIEEVAIKKEMMERAWVWMEKKNWAAFKNAIMTPNSNIDEIVLDVETELRNHFEKQIEEREKMMLKHMYFEAWKAYTKILRKSKERMLKRPSVRRLSAPMLRKLQNESLFTNNASIVVHNDELDSGDDDNEQNSDEDNNGTPAKYKKNSKVRIKLSPRMTLERLNKRIDAKMMNQKFVLKRSDSRGFYVPSTDFQG